MIVEMKQRAPRDADEWINSFVALADRFPACIVITDMTIAGAPMIYVNRGTYVYACVYMYVRTYVCTYGWTDGWMDGWMDGCSRGDSS